MTARNCCVAAADNNLLSLPDLPCLKADGALQPVCRLHSFGENMARQIFSF
jgi:hypothetical protein